MKNLTVFVTAALLLGSPTPSSGYLMAKLTYEDLFKRADIVVIATPLKSMESKTELAVDQPEKVKKQIVTIDTEFKVAYTLKGELEGDTFHLLHLNKKPSPPRRPEDPPKIMSFGAVGTFFVHFEEKGNKGKSYMLFLKRNDAGYLIPAWNVMEGSRAIIPVRKDGAL